MILGIDPKVDYAFKRFLGTDATRPILIDVLNSILNLPSGRRIEAVELLNPFNAKETLDDKLSILDIKACDQSGRQFNVEMEMFARLSFPKRIVYYAARFHQRQLREGEDYSKLKPTISISFLNGVLFPKLPDYHLRFRLLEETHRTPLTDDLEFHILELPKFTKSAEQLADGSDIWLYFLRHAEKMDTDALPAALRHPLVLRAVEELKMVTQSEIEYYQYESRRRAQMDRDSDLKDARMEGQEEGIKIGAIHFCERLLKRTETPKEQLASLSLEELSRRADELQNQVLQQQR